MAWWRKSEKRASIENPTVPVSSSSFLEFFGLGDFATETGIPVTVESALGVPAIWCAVNVLAGELAILPLSLYRRTSTGREAVASKLATLLHDAVNDETSSYNWRVAIFTALFTGGRCFTHIERSAGGAILNLWPLDPANVTVQRSNGRKSYKYRENGREIVYDASDIIDLSFQLKPDMLGHRGPIVANRDVIALAIASTRYSAKMFQNGGVPPFAVTGPFQSQGAMQRAADDMDAAVKKAAKDKRIALVLPQGLEVKPLGTDPQKMMLIEAQRFTVEQIARIWSIPPTFLQDLTHGTFSNTEQQDLHFLKHVISRWAKQFEQELNLKLFGRASNRLYVELNLDGLLRGDFITRMNGYAQAIQHGIMTPNEVRAKENYGDLDGASQLFMQGAMTPITSLNQPPPSTQDTPTDAQV